MKRLLTVGTALLLATGCVPVAKDAGFADMQTLARERGVGAVRWRQSNEDIRNEITPILAKPLSGDDAVQVALLNNRRLRASFETLGVFQASYVRAATWRNPTLSFDIKLPDGADGGTKVEAGIVASLLDLLRLPAKRRTAMAEWEAARARVSADLVDFARDVRLAHLDVQAAGQTLELRATAEQAFAASDELAKRLRVAGNITALRAATEAAAYEEARLDTADARQQFDEARDRLAVMLGLADNDWTVESQLANVTMPAKDSDFAADLAEAQKNNLALAAARAGVLAAAERAGIAHAAFFLDDMDVGLATERETDGLWLTGPALTVPIPLFDWGQANRSRATAELRRTVALAQAQTCELVAALRTARAAVATRRTAAARYHDVLMPLVATVVEEGQKEYNAMLIDAFRLLEAKRQQVSVAVRYIAAARAAHAADVRLKALRSGGRAEVSSSERIDSGLSYSQEGGH